ncbi:MAG: recombinase family protein [Methanomicrobiales archaeon]|nr:recombinase family protein [Methanomicrobiales archaeon]
MKEDSIVYLNTRRKSDYKLQKEAIDQYCKYRFSIRNIFHDYRQSSKPPEKRDGFLEMLSFARESGIRTIILYNLTEFSKNCDHCVKALKNLHNEGFVVLWAEKNFIGYRGDPLQQREALADFIDFLDVYRHAGKGGGNGPAVQKKKRPIGRPRALDAQKTADLIAARREGQSISAICRKFAVSRSTVSKILANYPELKGEWKGTRRTAGPADE